ncbi:MAG: O-antigen ligase family protein [Pseudomonadales bacterium]|jgi:O-antigen ligase|nr:O-antigen ligase family protein [Pseudomonadales bacterium]
MDVPTRQAWTVLPQLVLLSFIQASAVSFVSVREDTARLVLAALIALAAAGFTLISFVHASRLRELRTVLAPVAAFLVWVFVTQAASLSPESSITHSWAWTTAALGAVVCWALVLRGQAVAVMFALTLFPGLAALHTGWQIAVEGSQLRFGGLRDPNISADLLLVLALVLVAWANPERDRTDRSVRGRTTIAFAGIVIAAFGIQILLSARIVMILLPVSLAALLWPLARGHWRFWPGLPLVVYGILSLLPWSRWIATPVPQFAGSVDEQFAPRLGLLRAAVDFWLDAPLAGQGLLTFGRLFRPVRGDYLGPDFGIGNDMVHNDWLQLLLEGGILWFAGLLAFAGAVAAAWWRLGPRGVRGTRSREEHMALAAAVGVGVILVHALLNFPLYDPSTLVAVLGLGCLAIGIAFRPIPATPSVSSAVAPAVSRRPLQLLVTAGLAAGFLFLFLLWYRFALVAFGGMLVGKAMPVPGLPPLQLQTATQVEWMSFVARRVPEYSIAPYAMAQAGAQLVRDAEEDPAPEVLGFTRDAYARAIEISPWQTEYYVQLARFLRESDGASLEERITLLRDAFAWDPQQARVWLAIVVHLELAGEYPRASRIAAEEWLPHCTYGTLTDPISTLQLLARIRPPDRERVQNRIEICEARLERIGLPPLALVEVPSEAATVTTPGRSR